MPVGFGKIHQVTGRASIADLFGHRRRCGLYIIRFTTGEVYAGQAVDVTRRYVQHRRVHPDIESISFCPVPRRRLDEEERALIQQLESDGHRLRNIVHTSVPTGPSDLDTVVDTGAQEQWLTTGRQPDCSTTRAVDETLRRRYQHRFERLLQLPESSAAMDCLRQYVGATVLAPRLTELAFWSVSCLPADPSARRDARVLARVNVNWQVVLTLSLVGDNVECSVYGARSVMEAWCGASHLAELSELCESDNYLDPGGQDQFNLIVEGIENTRRLLASPDVIAAARTFNLRLMRKGPCAYSRYHCFGLADRLLP